MPCFESTGGIDRNQVNLLRNSGKCNVLTYFSRPATKTVQGHCGENFKSVVIVSQKVTDKFDKIVEKCQFLFLSYHLEM